MNKKLLYSMVLALGTAAFSSCDLDEYNPSALDPDMTVNTYEVWKGMQTTCYSTLNDQLYTASDWIYVSEGGTDLWMPKSNGTGYQQVLAYEKMTPSYNSYQKLWKQCYAMITTCNTVINEAENVVGGNEADKKVIVAESRTLRALYYSILVTHFGPVTLTTTSNASLTGNVELYPVRSSEKDIYDFIINDLKLAIPDLGVKPFENNYARFTKKSAIGLLARVYAQRAGLGQSKYGDAQQYWQLCAETAEDLINNASNYGAVLYDDIADMWADANNRTNKEALMVAAGPDANNSNWAYLAKANKLSAYTAGGFYSEFFNSNHRPSDKGYFYGRLNSQNWQPTKYLMYCFNPEWDRRWEYTWQYAWGEWSMAQCEWVPYSAGQVEVTLGTCRKYGIGDTLSVANGEKDAVAFKLYPYADCDGIQSSTDAGNQFPAKIWPKGEHRGRVAKLLTVAPSGDKINTSDGDINYSGSTKAYAIPYPVEQDDDRLNTVFVHERPTDEYKAKCRHAVICLADLYDENDLLYGGTAQGSAAGNPPNIGNGTTSAAAAPGLIKFNWSFNGCFVASNLQIKTGDMYIMRMAEIYLLAAEAEQMLGNGTKAAQYVNTLRKRSARPGTESMWQVTSVSEDDIMDEYARELCGEFTRWALLKRHNAFETRLAKYNKRAGSSFRKEYYNRPVSQDFLNTILNAEEYGDNGYGATSKSGIEGIK